MWGGAGPEGPAPLLSGWLLGDDDVVAGAAVEDVAGAASALEPVVAAAAEQLVGAGVPDQCVVAGAAEGVALLYEDSDRACAQPGGVDDVIGAGAEGVAEDLKVLSAGDYFARAQASDGGTGSGRAALLIQDPDPIRACSAHDAGLIDLPKILAGVDWRAKVDPHHAHVRAGETLVKGDTVRAAGHRGFDQLKAAETHRIFLAGGGGLPI